MKRTKEMRRKCTFISHCDVFLLAEPLLSSPSAFVLLLALGCRKMQPIGAKMWQRICFIQIIFVILLSKCKRTSETTPSKYT
ncbi:MAG: hypothetical protein KBT12_07500 [Bacteroidales bacterium]|nr:hypothetical protein [Candidatus Physcousia equi]